MFDSSPRPSLLETWYDGYLVDQDATRLIRVVSGRYAVGTLARMSESAGRRCRRAAVLCLGYLGDFESSNAALGRALGDSDRGVRSLAENAIRNVWCRAGTEAQRKALEGIAQLNSSGRHAEAAAAADKLLDDAPYFAEVWNQRAIANFCLSRFEQSIDDCHQALELNPYHFGAAAGMGQSHLQRGEQWLALECFRRALRLYQDLDGVRANVVYLERLLKQH